MKDTGLLEIVHRLVVDEEYRTWFMTSPKQALIAELGISPSTYDSLIAALPVLMAGGMFAAAATGVQPTGGNNDWGRRP
jgi:hypothetical protein